jgi:hypothetical protein
MLVRSLGCLCQPSTLIAFMRNTVIEDCFEMKQKWNDKTKWDNEYDLSLTNFFLFESPFICKLYRYIQQMV